mmetsp:Transcript_145821/g.271526  ORF Transcript_145821/g.271526 Transcript_145821/m.271526 type:complete len:449 (-) Transcript_145821:267-1613(-)
MEASMLIFLKLQFANFVSYMVLLGTVACAILTAGLWRCHMACGTACGVAVDRRPCADERRRRCRRALSTRPTASVGPNSSQYVEHDDSRGLAPGITPPEPLFAEVAWLLASNGCAAAVELLRAARNAWKHSGDACRTQPGPACFRATMQGLARSRAPRQLFGQLIEEMCYTSHSQDALTEGCCVRYLCRAPDANIDDAITAYESMLALGMTPDLRTVECLAEACLRAKRPAAAQELVTQLDAFKLRPTPTLYAILITACGETGAVARGCVAFEQMRSDMQDDPTAMRLGYTSAIHMCAQNHQVERGIALFEQGRHAGCRLCGTLLAPLLAAAVQTSSEELALQLAAKARAEREARSAVLRICELLHARPGSEHLLGQVKRVLDGRISPPPVAALPSPPRSEPPQPALHKVLQAEPAADEAASPVCKATSKALYAFRTLRTALGQGPQQ